MLDLWPRFDIQNWFIILYLTLFHRNRSRLGPFSFLKCTEQCQVRLQSGQLFNMKKVLFEFVCDLGVHTVINVQFGPRS